MAVLGITSLTPDRAGPTELAYHTRNHWRIENRLHWIRDTAHTEDASRIRTGHAPRTMASLRNLAIDAHRLAATPASPPDSPTPAETSPGHSPCSESTPDQYQHDFAGTLGTTPARAGRTLPDQRFCMAHCQFGLRLLRRCAR
ncbi:hypothetical protein GCM10010178_49700 [Lentzea flava]|uniref:Transposase DDE domain-containing protein n=1 Tax=Lentzea flava TaxID=103732 RepID=A0ABQ2UUS6_9PSEU|nr:hypothetical protein GCM10010178_49700 [Lentzea flava]